MKIETLQAHLRAEGYGALIGAHGVWGLEIGDLRIERGDGAMTVAWTERGEITDLLLSTPDEAEACHFFLNLVSGRKLHFSTFRQPAEADAVTTLLRNSGIDIWRNDIPNFNAPGDARYRIFVDGRDLRRAGSLAPGAETG